MINGICHTNLDEYQREKWPTVFARVPEKGERVVAESGRTLKVCQITHGSTKVEKSTSASDGGWRVEITEEPYLKIELHKPSFGDTGPK